MDEMMPFEIGSKIYIPNQLILLGISGMIVLNAGKYYIDDMHAGVMDLVSESGKTYYSVFISEVFKFELFQKRCIFSC